MKKIIIETEYDLLSSNIDLMKSIAILWKENAMDLLFVPKNDKVDVILKFRAMEKKTFNNLVYSQDFDTLKLHIKLACGGNLINNHLPQSCSFNIFINKNKYALRASFHPSNKGECLSLRILRTSYFETPYSVHRYLTNGLNLIGGVTGSGKTTLMYGSLLQYEGHVITLEDPIEIDLKNIPQSNVQDIGFANGIMSALRNNPDLISIGEIRNEESAQAAIKAALTGHTVLATIHIREINHLIPKLIDLNCRFFDEVLNNVFILQDFKPKRYVYDNQKFKTIE